MPQLVTIYDWRFIDPHGDVIVDGKKRPWLDVAEALTSNDPEIVLTTARLIGLTLEEGHEYAASGVNWLVDSFAKRQAEHAANCATIACYCDHTGEALLDGTEYPCQRRARLSREACRTPERTTLARIDLSLELP